MTSLTKPTNASHPGLSDRLRATDPYQWFFPLGIVFGLLGVSLWILFQLRVWVPYPGLLHSELMTGGFFLTVATGFLMTAIPRFTGTASASLFEKVSVWTIAGLALVVGLADSRFMFHGLILVELALLIVFGARRLRVAVHTPPPSFVLVGFGLGFGLLGAGILCVHDMVTLPSGLALFGRQLFVYGMFYGLVLGIGSQLLPRIMGTRSNVLLQLGPTHMNPAARDAKKTGRFLIVGILLVASFVLEAWLSPQAGWLLRSIVVSVVVVVAWQVYRLPAPRGVLPWCLWVSAWMLVLGGWPGAIAPSFHVHGIHVLFIGSLSLMIFSVATRVVLSHGGHDQRLELNSKALIAMLVCLIIAMATRVAAPWIGQYFSHLAYASIMWIAASLFWSAIFLPRLFRRRVEP
jgi:uncharacterized protein involved in response to NO